MARLTTLAISVSTLAAATGGAWLAEPLLAQDAPAPAARAARGPTTVTGAVRDSTTGAPLAGTAIVLRDSLDRTVGQTVTDERGRYRLVMSAQARRVHVAHIGFRPADVAVPSDGTVPHEIALARVPFLLAPVHVSAAAHCPRRTNGADALGLLDQVRAGLLAAVIARGEPTRSLTVVSFEREFAPGEEGSEVRGGDERIARQTVHVRTERAVAAPFGASRTGAEFVAEGFRADSGRDARYFAPDAATLADDDFAAGYCFRVVAPDVYRPHEVGLGFAAPRHRDGRIDLDGVLWIDTVSRTLHDLTFHYVGLPAAATALRPGGHLSFREMPTGVSFIDRWSLRLVSGADVSDDARRAAAGGSSSYASSTFGTPPRSVAPAVQEIGGELAQVTWPDGRTWQAPLGVWRLHLTDLHGHPAAGAVATIPHTDYAGTADSTGTIVLTDLLPGPYTAAIVDPLLASLGPSHTTERHVVVTRDSTIDSRFTVEMVERAVARVRTPTSPLPGVAVLDRSRDSASMARNDGRSIESLLTGRFPGVVVTQTADGGLQIRIRGGANSFVSGEDPLYVVDGTPLAQGTSTLGFLNPNDIEKIEVLKNVQDTAIYGLRGTNGVIRITTTRPGRR